MKTIKLLSMIVFALFLIGSVNAMLVYGDWQDSSQSLCTLRDDVGNCQGISITQGQSIDFNADFVSINPPMTIKIILYNSQDNIIKTFESNLIINENSHFATYTIDSSIYNSPGNYELVLSANDKINSDTHSLFLTINSIQDTNKPVITLLGDNSITIIQGTTYTDAGATAYDQEDGDLTSQIQITGNVNTNVVGTYVLNYNVQDNSGNSAVTVTRTINVNPSIPIDTHAPVITLLGNEIVNVAVGTIYTDAGATAYDQEDGDLTSQIQITGNVNTNVVGTYVLNYNVQDNAGNSAQEVTRIVNVFTPGDTTAPIITVITPQENKEYKQSDLTLEIQINEVGEARFRLDNGVKMAMNYNGFSSGILTFTYDVSLNNQAHEVTFYATDAAGNTATKTVFFSVNTNKSNKENNKTATHYYQDNYEEQLYFDQFKHKKIVYLEENQPIPKLTWWQRFVAWLKRIFGFT